jgi:hypothetical protein
LRLIAERQKTFSGVLLEDFSSSTNYSPFEADKSMQTESAEVCGKSGHAWSAAAAAAAESHRSAARMHVPGAEVNHQNRVTSPPETNWLFRPAPAQGLPSQKMLSNLCTTEPEIAR